MYYHLSVRNTDILFFENNILYFFKILSEKV